MTRRWTWQPPEAAPSTSRRRASEVRCFAVALWAWVLVSRTTLTHAFANALPPMQMRWGMRWRTGRAARCAAAGAALALVVRLHPVAACRMRRCACWRATVAAARRAAARTGTCGVATPRLCAARQPARGAPRRAQRREPRPRHRRRRRPCARPSGREKTRLPRALLPSRHLEDPSQTGCYTCDARWTRSVASC